MLGAAKPKGISLHIGLNRVDPIHYAGWKGELVACENDAHDIVFTFLAPSAAMHKSLRATCKCAASA